MWQEGQGNRRAVVGVQEGTAAPGEDLSSRAGLTLPFAASFISRCCRPAGLLCPPPRASPRCLCGRAAELPDGLMGLGPGAQNTAQVFSVESCFFCNLLPDLVSALRRHELSEMGLALVLLPGAAPCPTSHRRLSSFSAAGPQPLLEPTPSPSGPPASAPETGGRWAPLPARSLRARLLGAGIRPVAAPPRHLCAPACAGGAVGGPPPELGWKVRGFAASGRTNTSPSSVQATLV